jgi:hypothetical protein
MFVSPIVFFGWGDCGVCSGIYAKGHNSHLNLYDFSTLRPSFEADFLFLKFCLKEKNNEKNCVDIGDNFLFRCSSGK